MTAQVHNLLHITCGIVGAVERGDLTGATLDGRYRVLEAVAEGAMGVVYRAERLKLGRIVAIKVLHDVLPNELSARKRFEIEATAMAKLEHPHCASVLDVGVHNDRPYVVMEFVRGANLKDLIDGGPQPIARAIEIVRQVLSGLAHAHEHGIIHRDIKPANLVLSHKTGLGDHVKILDFGLARLHDTGQNLTTGIVVGTPAYMAPEQVRGLALDHRIDLYACGVLLFELATGEKPFHSERDDPIEVCKMHLSAPIPRLDSKLPGVAFGGLEAVTAKALAKAVEDRYASAQEFAAALDAVSPGRGSRPIPPIAAPRPASLGTNGGRADSPGAGGSDRANGAPSGGAPSGSIEVTSGDVLPGESSAVELRSSDVLPADSGAAPLAPRARLATPPGGSEGATFLGLAVTRTPTPVPRATPPAATPTGRGRRRAIMVGAGLVAAIALVVIIAELTRGGAPATLDAGVAGAAPSGDLVARANQLVAQGDRDAALDVLVRGRRQYPDSGPLAYAAGRAYFARFYWSDGLRSFRDALRLEPTYRTDPELIKTVLRGFITTPSYNDELAGFLRDDIGGAAQSFLEETARDHPSAAIRARAAAELKRYR